jgi:hypothetical protein
MGGSTRVVVSVALAAVAMAALVRPAEAPAPDFTVRAYVSGHKKFFPDPIMGIRGEATVLKVPAVG